MSTLYFLKVDITVKSGQMANFDLCTIQLQKLVEKNVGWKLEAALSSITGVPNTVLHLWRIPSANALLEGMQYFASDQVLELYTRLLSCCAEQKQELFTAKRYNPLGSNTEDTAH